MKATMTIDKDGNWRVSLSGETPTEVAMINAVKVGYGVHVTSTRADDQIDIEGGKP